MMADATPLFKVNAAVVKSSALDNIIITIAISGDKALRNIKMYITVRRKAAAVETSCKSVKQIGCKSYARHGGVSE